jgi:hypothetical protein
MSPITSKIHGIGKKIKEFAKVVNWVGDSFCACPDLDFKKSEAPKVESGANIE